MIDRRVAWYNMGNKRPSDVGDMRKSIKFIAPKPNREDILMVADFLTARVGLCQQAPIRCEGEQQALRWLVSALEKTSA